jgi:hypothetical protein
MPFHPPLQSAASSADANQQGMYNELYQVHKHLQMRYDQPPAPYEHLLFPTVL